MSETKTDFEKSLDKIRQILDLVEGRTDIKKRIEVLLRPEQPKTSSKITLPQVSYCQDAYWLGNEKIYPEFEALKIDADELLETMLSHDGFGVKSTIDLQKALTHGEVKETMIKESLPQKISRRVKGEEKPQ